MRSSLYRQMQVLAGFLLLSCFSVQAQAVNFPDYNGLWVVDIEPTAQAWAEAGKAFDQPAYAIVSAHTMRVNFDKKEIIEGIVIADRPEEHFTVRPVSERVYDIVIVQRLEGDDRIQRWEFMEDGRIRVASPVDPDEPPLFFFKETLVAYSGLWRMEAPEQAIDDFRKAEPGKLRSRAEIAEALEFFKALRLRVDFEAKTLFWEDNKGESAFFDPTGYFYIKDRAVGKVTLARDSTYDMTPWEMLGPDRVKIMAYGIPLTLVRVR